MCNLRNKIVPLSLVATLLLSLLTGCTDIQDRPSQVQSNSSFAQAESSNPPEGIRAIISRGAALILLVSLTFPKSPTTAANGMWLSTTTFRSLQVMN